MVFSREILSENNFQIKHKNIEKIKAPRNIEVLVIADPYLSTINNFDIILKNTNGILPKDNQTLLESSIEILRNKGLNSKEILLIVFKEKPFLKKYLREKEEFASIKTSLLDYSFIQNEAQKRGSWENIQLFSGIFQAMINYNTKNDIYQHTQYSRKKFEEIINNPNFWLYTIKNLEDIEQNEEILIKYLPKKTRDQMLNNYLQRYKEESNDIPICARNLSPIFHIHHSQISKLINQYHINRTQKIFREKEFNSSEETPFLEEIWEMMKDHKTKGEIKKTLACYTKNLQKIFSSEKFENYVYNLPKEEGVDKKDLLFRYLGKNRKIEILKQRLLELKSVVNQDQIIDIVKLTKEFHLDFYIVRNILKEKGFNTLKHPIKKRKTSHL